MFDSILVAFDGSDHAGVAVKAACDIAGKYDAPLHIVYVPGMQGEPMVIGGVVATIPETEKQIVARAAPVIEKAATLCRGAGVTPAAREILHGFPAEAILDYAFYHDIDLIVSGRRGMGRLKGLLLGSVSQKLTSLAKCAVLTVG